MRKQHQFNAIILFVSFMAFLIPVSLSPEGENTAGVSQVSQHLQTLEALVNPPLKWKLLLNKKTPPGDYRTGKRINRPEFILRTRVKGIENTCGTRVLETPMHLKLKLYSKGFSEVEIKVGKRTIESFTVDGSSGTGAEVEKEIVITPTTALEKYKIMIFVKNKGFKPFRTGYWPPRKKEPKEENASFSLQEAEVFYPAAADTHMRMKYWLLSMKIAHALLYPDFKRYTFIGKPYEIPDKRNTPKEQLEGLKNKLAHVVNLITPELLTGAQPRQLVKAVRQSYRASRPLRRFARKFKVYLIGNAHIDIAWLWRMSETVLVARNTYDTVMKNMDEYPELHYAQSQALTYEWMEKEHPGIFKRIKEKIEAGTWEVVGGMWVEPDCNLISGESWVRQLLYGKRYFKEKFGLEVDTGWNPDSFGYNWNMPQIYTKSGIKRFITQKIWWNDTTVFPHFIFRWQGVDDTQIMTYFPPVGYTSRVRLPEDIPNITRYEATTGYKKTLLLYGLGDHGGGPNREILDRVRDYQKLHIAPRFIHSKSIEFLQQMEPDLKENIPVWKDELYLEYHRGTYTTQAEVKKNNRHCESLLSSAGKLASIAFMMGNDYPGKKLEEAWKIVLTNQFHDILPGSSITPVYRDAPRDYEKARRKIDTVITRSLEKIAGAVDTTSVAGTPLIVFNTLSWLRTGLVTAVLPVKEGHKLHVLDDRGKEVPVTVETGCDTIDGRVSFIAKEVPAVGYRVYSYLFKEDKPSLTEGVADNSGFIQVENKFFSVKINKTTGNIAGLFDKRLKKEFVETGKEANVLQVYEDLPERWDAWNIGYTGRMWELNQAQSVSLVEDSSLRKVVKVQKNFLGLSKHRYSPTEEYPSSFFTQYIILYHDIDRIDIKTEADWWEDHMMLKAAFPVSIKSDFATYEIPFASIERTTKFETLWEKARFEVPALRWADLSDSTGGISLLNAGKYGYDIHGNVIKLSLLRAPTWPDPLADRGKHTFVYSLYTHKGDVTKGETVKRARELNTPLQVVVTAKHGGTLPREGFGFFNVKSGSVILETVKKAEDGDGIIFRLYESKGAEGSAELSFFKVPKRVHETDLMENEIGDLPLTGESLSLNFKKFEIKTIKLIF
ncbi:MAG: alpha-mannosidase [bacterium]|nr:alpha-mannosidase [bacterium]